MKIQVIGLTELGKYKHENITVSTFSKPYSLDEFDVNIVDVSNENIWRNNQPVNNTINIGSDLIHTNRMIKSSNIATTLIILPQNIQFKYNCEDNKGQYLKGDSIELKKMLDNFKYIVFRLIYNLGESYYKNIEIYYEPTKTKIDSNDIEAAFYFKPLRAGVFEEMTLSNKSEKATTIKMQEIIFTFLNLDGNVKELLDFLNIIGLSEQKQSAPDWFKSIDKFDDKQLKERNIFNQTEIGRLTTETQKNIEQLKENNFYKSILYTNGSELIEATYNILEELLNCSLSEFVDEYKEDFSIEKEKNVFVGEIKGVTSNVKNRHVSQIDNHVQDYNDKPEEEKNGKTPKGILIINYQREREPSKRDPIGENQISIAKRDGSLIITTFDLLDLHEDFRNGKITSEEIIEKFSTQTGLFKRS